MIEPAFKIVRDDPSEASADFRPPPIRTRNVFEFMHANFPPREMMLAPWLPVQGIAMVHAPRGGSKTHLALGTAWAVASGTGFLKWQAPEARRVLLLDGEMPRAALQDRLVRISQTSSQQPIWDNLQIAAADDQDLGLPDLSNPEAQRTYYAPLVADADLVIVDNLSTLCRSIRENEADSWQPMQDWALSLRRAAKSVLFIHHGGKSGAQRGTSKKEDIADSIISLRKPPDYTPQDGARFEIHFEKARGFFGQDAEPFEAKLVGEQWELNPIKSGDDVETLRTMKSSGMTYRQIEERTGVPRSTIARKLGDEP
jgi:hypothetical protein